MKLENLTDKALIEELTRLRGKEKEIQLELLKYLKEVDRRRLYLNYGYPSLFAFAVGKLGYSDSGAGRRISAARCIAEHPELVEKYSRGEVTLGTISAVAGTLRKKQEDEEKSRLIEEISGASTREVERIVAKQALKSAPKESVKPVFVKDSTPSAGSGCQERYELRFSVSAECRAKLEQAAALLSNKSGSGGEVEKVFEALLNEFLERKSREKREARRAKRQPRKATASSKRSRHIPAATRDQVYLRDGGQCSFVSENGTRCSAKKHLQVDHISSYVLGGGHELENLQLLCREHNMMSSENCFGEYQARKSWRKAS